MKKILPFALASALLFSSCATIFTGTEDRITFKSNPSGAKVFLDGIELCETPCSEYIDRSINRKEVEFVLDGYRTKVVTLDREFNIVSVLNTTGLIGWAVDLVTGSVYKYSRKHYDVDLEPERELVENVKKAKEIHLDSNTKEATIYVQP